MKISEKIISFILLLTIILGTSTLFYSCKGPITDEMAKEIISPLLVKEAEINGYIYGDKFRTEDDPGDDVNSSFAKYYRVAEDSKYKSIADLKAALSEVYTEKTVSVVCVYAFDGYTDEEDGGASIRPRFEEDEKGYLQIDVAKDPYDMRGVIHPDTVRVIRSTNSLMRVKIDYSRFSKDGRETVIEKTLELSLENGSWRLNTQTFAVKSE